MKGNVAFRSSPLGVVPDGWSTVSLKDIALKVGSGATPTGGDAVYLKSRERFALIRSQNVFDRYFDDSGLAFISDLHATKLRGVQVQPGDLLLNITGDGVTFGRACLAPEDALPACVNQHVAIIRVDQRVCEPGYLLAYLTHPTIKHYIDSFNSGGSRRAITKGHIESFQIPLPPLFDQRAIAHILGSLDDKIELNRRMNETLEGMTRALFQSWFVDFDPVRAKAEGRRPVGMDAETAALFPDGFEESELGEIPQGWQVKPLDGIADFLNGLAMQKYPPQGDETLPVVKIAELRAGNVDGSNKADIAVPPQYVIDDGDVIFSWSGSLEARIWSGGRGALNQHLFKVTSSSYPRWFFYRWIYYHLPEFRSIAADKATTMGHIQRRHLTEALVLIPPADALEWMSSVMAPLHEKQIANELESRTLAALRDTLLSKLLSGEVRVKEAVQLVEAQALRG